MKKQSIHSLLKHQNDAICLKMKETRETRGCDHACHPKKIERERKNKK